MDSINQQSFSPYYSAGALINSKQILNMFNTFKMYLFHIYFTFSWQSENQMYFKYIWSFTWNSACLVPIFKYILNTFENDYHIYLTSKLLYL